jgi:RHS repeat-associated protein
MRHLFLFAAVALAVVVPQGAHAARLWSSGFELQSLSAGMEWDTVTGSPSISTATKRSGAATLRCAPSASTAFVTKQIASNDTNQTFFYRFYVRIDTAPAALSTIFKLGGLGDFAIKLNTNRTFEVWDEDNSQQLGSDSAALGTGTWHRVEIKLTTTVSTDSIEQVVVKLDGTEFVNVSGLETVDVRDIDFDESFNLGCVSAMTADLFFDDVAVNDPSGSIQNSYPGAGSIVHIYPNAAGDTVQGNSGPTTGQTAYQMVDEKPSSNNATDYWELVTNNDTLFVNVESSSAAGIASGDTVTLIQAGVRHVAETASSGSLQPKIKSASSGTISSGTTFTHNDITWKTNGDSLPQNYALTSYIDPTTGVAWTPTGTNSLDNMQIGISAPDASPDMWVSALWALIEYVPAGGGGGTSTPTTSPTVLQDISYSYDAVGNITAITDRSPTGAAKTVAFTYDDLNRLTLASTTAASSSPFSHTYTYNALGNVTNRSDVGAYSYSGTGYTNPHAPTAVAGTAYTYDNNGNTATRGLWSYAWDFLNRMTRAGNGSATSTYGYDHANSRVREVSGSATTTFPSKYFNRTTSAGAATTTSYIYAGDTLLASLAGTGTGTTTRYVHSDHLGSTNVLTTASGTLAHTLDYYPFGSERINAPSDGSTEHRTFIGEYADVTDLSYFNARYYDGTKGQFLSQDPSFLDIGAAGFEKKYERKLQQHLMNPQALNSYSYGLNNPIINKDPEGEIVPLLVGAWAAIEAGLSAYDAYSAYQTIHNPNSSGLEKSIAIGGFAAGLYAPGGGYGGSGRHLLNIVDKSSSAAQINKVSAKISSGHAFSKHIGQFTDLGISTKAEFSKHVSEVMKNPTVSAKLEGGRSLFYDSKTNTAVFVDPKNKDLGTAFRPGNGESYIRNIIKNQERK